MYRRSEHTQRTNIVTKSIRTRGVIRKRRIPKIQAVLLECLATQNHLYAYNRMFTLSELSDSSNYVLGKDKNKLNCNHCLLILFSSFKKRSRRRFRHSINKTYFNERPYLNKRRSQEKLQRNKTSIRQTTT